MAVLVVCAILVDPDGFVLIAQRSDSKFWEFPGGKVEEGEAETVALARELMEELNVEATKYPFQYFADSLWHNGRKEIHLKAYLAKVPNRPEITLVDHLGLNWVPPLELDQWSMTPADLSLVQELMRWATKS